MNQSFLVFSRSGITIQYYSRTGMPFLKRHGHDRMHCTYSSQDYSLKTYFLDRLTFGVSFTFIFSTRI